MMLKANTIADGLHEGRDIASEDPLVIVPCPDLKQLRKTGGASVDLRLGTWFVTPRKSRMTHMEIDTAEAQLTKTHYVPFGKNYILHASSFVLATTLEWIRLPRLCAGYVIGKSTWGRRGLIIATASAVHPGFTGCLTLELTNVGEIPIEIKPGMSICQLCIHSVEGCETTTDQSSCVGRRKPALLPINQDTVSAKLGNAYRGAGADD